MEGCTKVPTLGVIEAMLTAAALEAGPVYFFDQMETRIKEKGKKIPEFSSYFAGDLPAGFTPTSIEGRSAICTVVQSRSPLVGEKQAHK
ncbi:uncharacterized protein PRD47_012252 isoform 1-T1 [Ara ararauna]